jgi:hypothetical protein
MTAATAARYRTSAVASLTRLSPSMIVTIRRGTPSRRPIDVAAIGSVGETTAPRTKAADHGIPSTAQWATMPTARVVAATSPTERRPIGRTFARRSRSDVKNAAEYSSGGRNAISTTSGGSSKSGSPGTRLSASPPSTSRIGYGIRVRGARTRSAPTAVSSPSSCNSSSRCSSTPSRYGTPVGAKQRRGGENGRTTPRVR